MSVLVFWALFAASSIPDAKPDVVSGMLRRDFPMWAAPKTAPGLGLLSLPIGLFTQRVHTTKFTGYGSGLARADEP